MKSKPNMFHADFDGTLFDPGAKILFSPFYNRQTTQLLNQHNILFVLNTGRPVWDRFSDIQLLATGMKLPDVIVAGAGTVVLWKNEHSFARDLEWDTVIKSTKWNKQNIIDATASIFKKEQIRLFDTANPYMTRAWTYRKNIPALLSLKSEFEALLPNTKVLLTEQILLPNTESVFSGYFLFVPSVAGKENGAAFVNKQLEKKHQSKLKKIYFGDALVDVPMLTFDTDKDSAAFCIHPTPLAKKALKGSKVEILDGNAPKLILNILKSHLHPEGVNARNSPFRRLISPLANLLNATVDQKLTPDQISLRGLEYVQKAVDPTHRGGVFLLVKGYLMDLVDGIRARKHPEMATKEGQLIDVYSDRMKEFSQLMSRNQYNAALSCIVPSIARAQAEALGLAVPEYDPAGGSMLSRTNKLIRSFMWYSLGFKTKSQQIDEKIYQTNIASYKNRKIYAKNFSWSKLKVYDKKSVERLLFLIWLLQKQLQIIRKKRISTNLELKSVLKEFETVETKDWSDIIGYSSIYEHRKQKSEQHTSS